MRKAISVLVMLVVVLLCAGVEEARAAEPNDDQVRAPATFALFHNGVEVQRGDLIEVKTNEVLSLRLEWLSYNEIPVATSHDITNVTSTIGIPASEQNPTIDGVTVHVYFSPILDLLEITPQGVVDGVLSIQITTTIKDLNGERSFPTVVFPIRLKTSVATDFKYLFVPKSMSLWDESGRKVSSIYMEATQTKELYAAVDDYLNDAYPDNDYDVYPVNSSTFNMAPVVLPESDSDLTGTSTTPTLVGLTPTPPTLQIPPQTIARVRITARNPGGDQSSNYQPVYTDFVYQITFAGTTTGGVPLANFLPNGGVVQTPRVSVVIFAKDDATGTFDDAGGSCDFLGLGALALLIPAVLVRRKK